jgi:hypothetical protein
MMNNIAAKMAHDDEIERLAIWGGELGRYGNEVRLHVAKWAARSIILCPQWPPLPYNKYNANFPMEFFERPGFTNRVCVIDCGEYGKVILSEGTLSFMGTYCNIRCNGKWAALKFTKPNNLYSGVIFTGWEDDANYDELVKELKKVSKLL